MHFANPRENVLQIGLKEGMKVADLGSGTGHYALSASPILGEEGRVYAVDIQEDTLRSLKSEAQSRGYKNVETVWGDLERPGGTRLRDHSMDAVILSNTLFQLEKKNEAIGEIKRILRPGGRLLVIDWAGGYDGLGPHNDRVVSEYVAEELFITAGFHKTKAFRAGPHHYSLLFTAP